MSPKFHRNPPHRIQTECLVWAAISLLILFTVCPTAIVGQVQRGDANGDGVIDGRDALTVLRVTEGLAPGSEDVTTRGDVYPYPGIGGQMLGDGRLTREDADKILRHTVGLLPDGELTGDFSGSMPRIEDFEPRSGPIGTRVEIIGTNFLPGIASDNMVLFGDVQAPILEISGTRILTEVPAGAITALIRVRTPGGTAISNGEFVVTYPVKGSVTLDGGLNPADFILTSGYDELDGIPINGQFEIQVPQGRVALLGAVSKGPSNNSYLSFLLPPKPGQEDPEAPTHINAYTTAKALVLMHPYFLTDDPAMVRYLHTLMDGLPEIIALAQAIAQHYPGGADGLNFPAVEAAWLQAVVALSNSLPASLLCAISPDGSLQPAKASKTDPVPGVPSRPLSKPDSEQVFHANPSANLASVPDTHIYGMDQDFVEANYDDKVHGVLPALFSIERPRWAIPINIITPERITYSPVDWVVALYRIDPVSMPRGINESFVNLRWRKLETTGYNVITTAPANLWTAKIDILYTLIDQAINSILETFYPSGNTLRFQDTNDGVYMLRAFSGAVYHPTQKDDFIGIDNIVNGRDMELTATAINIALAAVDQWDLCTGESKRWARAGMKKAIQNSVRKLSQEFVSVDRSRLTAYDCAAILGKTLVEAGKGFASALPQAGVTYAQEKMLATLESTATRLNTVLSALDKISSAGRVMERLIGLLGYMANPLAFELSEGPSPLESTIIVIGDPFSPKVTSIEPTEGGADAIVTLTGERFQPDVEDNYVYFQDQYENRTEIPVVAVRNRTQMDIRIPSNLTNNTIYRVYVRTSAGTNDVPAPRRFLYKRIPRLTGITPQTGFAPIADAANPVKSYSAYGGTKVTLQGYSFLPFLNDEVHFGDATASIDYDSITNTQIPVTVPALSPGTYPVYLLSPQNNNAETDRFDFTVLPAPVLTNIVPSSAKIGQRVTVFGQNFGNETQAILIQIGQPPEHSYVRADSVSGATAVFRMPTIGAPNESMPITVWTPSGQSESRTITRAAGIGEARTVNLPEGWSIQVNTEITGYLQDRHISLDEAAAFGRGELDPFSAGWDDTNIIVETHWYPRIDPTTGDITSWTEGATHQRTEPAGPGTESTFYYGLYHNTDGTISRVPGGAESRDNGPENMEEGDYITGVSRDRGGANFADTISVSSTFTRVLHTWNLTLGNDDDLYVEQVHLEADGMNLRHGSIVYAATITADPRVSITISGDDNLLTASCIDFPSHAVLVQGGFRNTINVNIFDCQGTGITLRGGGGNEVQIYQIQRCAEYGIRVEQSELNTIYQRYHSYDSQELDGIVACDQGAVFLDRAHENTLTIQANANLGFGVGLSGSNLNKLNLEVRNTLGEALFLDNSCENELLSGDFIDNARGIALQGGSQSNTLTSAWILGTLNSGILIDGEGTSKNVLNHCDVSGDETGRTIGGNGILIQGGAHHNHIKNTSVTGCEENGVRITGIGTDSNVIEDSWLGWLGDAEQGIYDTNDGWGVQIADHAFQSDVKYCVFGGNMLGGISVLNVAPPAGMEEFYSFVLRYNSIGFTEVVVTLPGQSAFDPSDYYLNWTGGSGISLNQARGGLLLGNMIHAHNQGIRLENTTDNDIEEQRIDHSITDGICATASNSDYIEWPHIGYPAGNGIHLSGCDGTTLVAGYAQSASRNGVLIDSSTDILVHEMQIGPRNEMGGLSILFSQDITVENCNSVQNLKNGYDVVLDSSNVTFNCSHADSNGQNGYFIADSSNVRMFGERPREGLWVFNNGEAGIDVLNAQNIHIGYDGKGVNVSGYTTAGILIAGNETDSVQITSSIVPNNGQILGEYGIHVLGGKNITIGGPLEVQGNNIELWNQIGILVEGADTGVSITNNLIGEPEIWESGTRAYGNRIGIQLKNNVQKAFISRNIINANQDSGIVLSDGA
ncbi:MAG TPA: right-handed parallel beta-helix repeat-containing protein, partial [bacterium]|nr:right-handed parallel beta-helix repeat-containing protein [bacterium]